jgi:hypothetical protein
MLGQLTGELVGRTRLRQLFSAPLRHRGRRHAHGGPFAGTRREMAAGSSTSAEPLLPGPVAFTSCCRRANAGAGRSASARWPHRGTPSRLVPAVSVLTAWPLVLTCDSDRNTTEFVGGRRHTRLGAGHLEPHARRAGHERVGPAATGGRITAGPRLGCSVGTWKRLLALHPVRDLAGGTTSGTRVLRPPAAVARPEVLGHQGLRLTPCQTS